MSAPLTRFAWWLSGTNENSLPANENSLRNMILNRSAESDSITAQPTLTSPDDDGTWYIIPAGATGTQWATFNEDSAAVFFGDGWYEFVPEEGAVAVIEGDFYRYGGSSGWVVMTPGGAAPKHVNVALSDMTTTLTTGTSKAVWFAPEDGELLDVWLGNLTPSGSGVVRVDVNNGGSTVLSTRPAIDAGETTSLTGTAAVISSPSFNKGDRFTFDIDDAGTTAAGLQVVMEYTPG